MPANCAASVMQPMLLTGLSLTLVKMRHVCLSDRVMYACCL